MLKKLKISVFVILVVSFSVSTTHGWFRKKTFERLGVSPPSQKKIEPAKCVAHYYEVRGKETKAEITLRGTKSLVKFPWTKMKDENKFYTLGMLWTSAQELYFSAYLDEKVVLHGVAELTVKDSILDLLEDIDEGLSYMGADKALIKEIEDLGNRIREESMASKEPNPEIAARFDSVGTDMLEFVLREYGSSYVNFVDFGSWIYYLRLFGKVIITLNEAGEKELSKELSDTVTVLLKYVPTYESLCTIYALPGAVKRNIKVLSEISQEVIYNEKNLLDYAGRIKTSAEDIEYAFLTI